MPRVPGAVGRQQFGIGLFVEAGDTGQVTTPDNWGTSQGENVTRLERVIYDQTSSPIFVSTTGITSTLASAHGETDIVTSRVVYDQTATPVFLRGAQQPYPAFLEAAANIIRRAVVGSLTAFAAASAMAEPVFVPSQVTTAVAPSDVAAKARKISLPDGYAAPVVAPTGATATPSEFAYQPVEAVWRVQKKLLPDGFTSQFRILAATPFEFAYQPVEAVWRVQRKILPDGFSSQFRILAPTPDVFGYQTVDATWRQQRKVLPDGIAVPLTAPATARPIAPSDAVARARRISLPDGYAAPVTPPAAVPAAVSVGALANSLTVVRTSLIVGDQTSTPGFPPVVTGTPVELRWVPSNSLTVVRTVCVVLDQVSVPPPRSPYVAPVAYVGVVHSWDAHPSRQRIKPIPLSAFVFAYPIDDLATNDGYEDAFVRPIRAKRKILPDGIAQPPFQPVTVTPPAVVPLACAYGSATVVLTRVVYDTTAAPIFKPVVVVVPPTFYQADEGAPQRRVSRPGIKLDLEGFERPTTQQQTLFWFETYPAVRTAPIRPAAVRSNLDGFDRPVIQITVTPSYLFETIPPGWTAKPNSKAIGLNLGALQASQGLAPPPTVTPSFLFEAIPPPWTAKPNAVAIKTDLDGFRKPDALPAPPTSTPAILFDVIPPVQRTLPNRVAIKIDLDGFAWTPQRPQDLTGVIFVPPITTHYPTGGESYWHVTHKKPAKTDQRCRFVTIDGVLTWICDRLDYERAAEARLQALDLVYDAEGILEPLFEAVRLEEATNASEAKRAAATLLMHAIHEAVLEEEDDDLLLLD